jgi:hypothetical protein
VGHPYGDDYNFDWHADHITRRNRQLFLEKKMSDIRRKEKVSTVLEIGGVIALLVVVAFLVIKAACLIFVH